jgi:hypothetical protein
MSALRNLLPSMFHRRLLLLAVVIGVTSCALVGQVVRLAVVSGSKHLAEAESVLSFTKLVPARRGRIVDRKNRVLAEDQPCWDLAVDYEVISGEWAYRRGLRAARRAHREDWGELSFEQQEVLAAAEAQRYQRRAEALWQAIVTRCHIDREELERRKRLIVRRVQVVRASVWERRAARRQRSTGRQITLGDIVVPIREEKQAHTLVPALDEPAMAFFRKYEEQEGRNGMTTRPSPDCACCAVARGCIRCRRRWSMSICLPSRAHFDRTDHRPCACVMYTDRWWARCARWPRRMWMKQWGAGPIAGPMEPPT